MCEESSHMCEGCSHFPHPSCPPHLFHVCPIHMRVKLSHTCVRSHASHTSYTCHIKGFSHMCEHISPLWMVKTLIHMESTWPPPHWSWEILALHLAFNLSRPLHLSSPIKGEPSPHFHIYHLPHCYAAGFVSNHIPWAMKSSITWWFHEVCICAILISLMFFFISCYLVYMSPFIFWGVHNHVGIDALVV